MIGRTMRRVWRRGLVTAAGVAGLMGTTRVAGAQRTIATHESDVSTRNADALLSKKITLTLTAVSLRRAIDSAAHVAGVVVQYRDQVLDAYPTPVSVRASSVSLGVVLEQILAGTPLRVTANREGYLAIVPPSATGADSLPVVGDVSGRVVDSVTGRGLLGATVKVAGTKLSVLSTDSGRFVLRNLPVGEYLVSVKLFGYRAGERTVNVTAGQRASVRISLASAPNVLSGVVTTATGERDRRTMGNDITVIRADSVMRTAPIRTVTDLLEGRVPGLTVTHTSGIPGAPSRLRLRGVGGGLVKGSTLTNDPIVIVDGIRIDARQSNQRAQNSAASTYTTPSPIDQIDPNSVETIEVFKGPSASALYGADAANGVIVITTKKGRAGPTRVTVAADYGLQYLPGTYARPGIYNFGHNPVMGGGTVICASLDLYDGAINSGLSCVSDSLTIFQALNVPRLSLFGTGTNTGVTTTVIGGNGSLTYALTGSATRALGYIKMPSLYQDAFEDFYGRPPDAWMRRPDVLNTWSGSGTFTSTPTPALQLQYVTSLNNSDQRQSSGQNQISRLSSTYIDTVVGPGADILQERVGDFANRITGRSFTVNNALSMSWSRWASLSLRADAGLSTVDREDISTVSYGIISLITTAVDSFGGTSAKDKGFYAYGRPSSTTRTGNAYAQLFHEHLVSTGIGMNLTQVSTRDFVGRVSKLSPGITVPSQFTSSAVLTSQQNTGGWFAEPRLNFRSRLFASPGFRIDNSGSSGSVLSQLFTPKMDISWIAVDRQDQRPLAGVFTLIRPRLAFGVSSIQPEPTWRLRSYRADRFDSTLTYHSLFPGIRLEAVGNPLLRQERSREIEGGAETQLWGNRLTVTTTGYYKLRLDAIELVPLAPSAGGISGTQYQNLGRVRNTGLELSVQMIPVQNSSTVWSVNATLSTDQSTVLGLNGGQPSLDLGNGQRIVPGYPINGRWDRPIMGYVQPDTNQDGTRRRLGWSDLRVGDSVAYFGTATPKYTLPVSSSLTLFGGAFGINASMQYEHGFTQFGTGNVALLWRLYIEPGASLGQQAAALAALCWYAPNQCGSRLEKVGTLAGVIQTVNVLRLQSFSVNYNLPRRLRERLRLPRTSLALQGSNLGMWSNYRGKDPDVNGSPVGEAIIDDGQVPLPRVWGFRITLGQ